MQEMSFDITQANNSLQWWVTVKNPPVLVLDLRFWFFLVLFFWVFFGFEIHLPTKSKLILNPKPSTSTPAQHVLSCRAPASVHHCSVATICGDPDTRTKASGPEHWVAKAPLHYIRGVRNFSLHYGCCVVPRSLYHCKSHAHLPFSFSRSNIIYVASNHFVWRLIPVPMATQIQQLLQDKQFELALQLAVSLVP